MWCGVRVAQIQFKIAYEFCMRRGLKDLESCVWWRKTDLDSEFKKWIHLEWSWKGPGFKSPWSCCKAWPLICYDRVLNDLSLINVLELLVLIFWLFYIDDVFYRTPRLLFHSFDNFKVNLKNVWSSDIAQVYSCFKTRLCLDKSLPMQIS